MVAALPLAQRRSALEIFGQKAAIAGKLIVTPHSLDLAQAREWLADFGHDGRDGVVAKRLDAPYLSGEQAMLKVKRLRTADCVVGDTVNYEFIRMPDSNGFGDYTETGQVIPVRFRGADGVVQEGGYVHAMYLDDNAPIAGGREIWGFPKKLAKPKISHQSETIVCTLHFGSVLCVSATMGYKYREIDPEPVMPVSRNPAS